MSRADITHRDLPAMHRDSICGAKRQSCKLFPAINSRARLHHTNKETMPPMVTAAAIHLPAV